MLTKTDELLLHRAIELARLARQHGNFPFGALLTGPDGEVLAEAENTVVTGHDCTAHAEVNLVRLAWGQFPAEILARATLFTSTEPCAMCAGAIHWGGISRVVYALAEERLYHITGDDLAEPPMTLTCREVFARCKPVIAVEGPALQEEAEQVHR
jgi:tRNA(Arg) A34 adenosine deaminase TadA